MCTVSGPSSQKDRARDGRCLILSKFLHCDVRKKDYVLKPANLRISMLFDLLPILLELKEIKIERKRRKERKKEKKKETIL